MTEARETTQAVYNLIAPKLEGIPDTQLPNMISETIKDELSHAWLYEQRLLRPFLTEFGGNRNRLTEALTKQYLQPVPAEPLPPRTMIRTNYDLTMAARVSHLFSHALTPEQKQQAVSSLNTYWLFRTAQELGYVTSFKQLLKKLRMGTRDGSSEWAEEVLTRLQPPVIIGKAPQYVRKGEITPRFTRFIATEDVNRACYSLEGIRQIKPSRAKPYVPTGSPRDFYQTSAESKIGDFRDHVAQAPGLYLASWNDSDIRSLLRFQDRAVVDAFWDHYNGNVLLAVRELIKRYQFPNLTFEAAYQEITTLLVDLHQIVKDKDNEETAHNDSSNPHGEPIESVPVINGKNGSTIKEDLKQILDPETVARAQMGDHAAFEVIFLSYWNPIYNFVYGMMGNPQDAADLTQETFMKAYQGITKTSHDLRVMAWIYRIATNNCLDVLRHRKLIKWQSLYTQPAPLSDPHHFMNYIPSRSNNEPFQIVSSYRAYNPEAAFFDQENYEEIQAILDRLHPKYRMGLILQWYHDLSYDEIAEVLNTTMGTVKSMLFRAKEEFRQVYARTERKPLLPEMAA